VRTQNRLRILALLYYFLIPFFVASPGLAQAVWQGSWETSWPGGGARVTLDQDGAKITGTYPLLSGKIEAIAEGGRLLGNWSEGTRQGSLQFTLSEDGQSFVGRRDGAEWWTGRRSTRMSANVIGNAETPRSTLRSFLSAGNAARDNDREQWTVAAGLLVFDSDSAPVAPGAKNARAIEYFNLLDLLTIRLADFDHLAPRGPSAAVGQIDLRDGSGIGIVFLRQPNGDWRINVPAPSVIARDRERALAAMGHPANRQPEAFEAMASPRDNIRSFLYGVGRWDQAGRALALSALDLSKFNAVTRDTDGELVALQLGRVLQKIGLEALQVIPNHVPLANEYEIFSHGAARFLLVADTSSGARRWLISSETVDRSMELLRISDRLPATQFGFFGEIPETAFFRIRQEISRLLPALLSRLGRMEAWQVLGAVSGLALAVFLAGLLRRLCISIWLYSLGEKIELPRWFKISLTFCFTILFATPIPKIFGIPAHARQVMVPLIGITLTFLLTAIAWYLIKIYSKRLTKLAEQTISNSDDIMISLFFAILRILTIGSCGLGIAYFLSISPVNILAGLGIGGLAVAFAARETIANIFGAAVLAVDRPFKRGDIISVGDSRGAVEHVGIRSTRLRTLENKEIVVPNSKVADTSITNHGVPEPIAASAIFRLALQKNPSVVSDFLVMLREEFMKLVPSGDPQEAISIQHMNGDDVTLKILTPTSMDLIQGQKIVETLALSALARSNEAGVQFSWNASA
jgi:small-conductance mechanosensitive channel